MTNIKDGTDGDKVGDVFFVGTSEEVSGVEQRLAGFNEQDNYIGFEAYGSYAGEAILKRSLGLNSLR